MYRAIDEVSRGAVAVKLQRHEVARDLEQASRLFEGAWAASRIHHPNIIDVFETGLGEFGPFIVMEELKGENAARVLARHGRLEIVQALALLEPVILALDAAHHAGLVHGDVKPENVFLTVLPDSRPTVKLLDFGTLVPGRQAGTSGVRQYFFGTAEYLSPEQASGETIDRRSDVFSLCVVLFELLTNSRPFHGPTSAATAYKIVNAPTPCLQEKGTRTGLAALSSIVTRGLAKNPNERYPGMRQLLDELRPFLLEGVASQQVLFDLLPARMSLQLDSGTVRVGIPTLPPVPLLSEDARSNQSSPALSSGVSSATRLRAGSLNVEYEPEVPTSVIPTRFRGRHHVRGMVWQSLDDYLRPRTAPALRVLLLERIANPQALELLQGTIQGIVHYDLEVVSRYVELATEQLFAGDPNWCRLAGREAIHGILAGALARNPSSPSHPLATLRRLGTLLGQLFDFGDWRVDKGRNSNAALLTISQLEAAGLGIRLWMVGIVERSLAVAHPNSSIVVARGENAFAPRIVIEVRC